LLTLVAKHDPIVQERISQGPRNTTYTSEYLTDYGWYQTFFALMETLYVFVLITKAHSIYVEQQTVLYPSKLVCQLQHLSDTWWACRLFATDAVHTTYGAIVATLQVIADGDDRSKATEATGILLQVQSFQYLTALFLFW